MVRIGLISLICATWIFIVLMGRIMPWTSALSILLVIMFAYMAMVSVAMVHQKRQERKKPRLLDANYLPRISVVVPAHNEELVIEGLVENLMALEYPDYELLVVDDRSTDDTPRKLQALAKQYPNKLRYHVRPIGSTSGKSAVLNEALTLTDGDVIAVFDADARVKPDFLTQLVPYLSEEKVGGVQARKVIANAEFNWLTRCQNNEYAMDSYFQSGRDTIRGAVEFRGNGQLVKRAALADVGGWNDASLTDDLDLSTRFHLAGWDIRFAHQVHVYEEGVTRLKALLRQRRRWSEGALTRYLEYAADVLLSRDVSFRSRLDLIAFIIEFLFPIWLASDYLYLAYLAVLGDNDPNRFHVISSLFMLPLLSVFFFTMLSIAILRFLRPSLLQTAWQALVTSVYLTLVWVPTVFWVTLKMMLQKERCTDWGKTEHSGAAEQTVELG